MPPTHPQPVSIIIPFRNEAANLPDLLAALAQLQLVEIQAEIILVDDHSTDNSTEIITQFLAQDPNLAAHTRLLRAEGQGKKAALATGIAYSTSPLILCTDADTTPPPQWVTRMLAPFHHSEVVAVCGPVTLTGTSLFQRLQSLESAGLVSLGAGAIALGYPTLANGANFAFRRSAFNSVGGYSDNQHIASGDDELLLHKLARQGRIAFIDHQQATVPTPALSTWAAFRRQRIRWLSKTQAYRNPPTTIGQFLGLLGQVLLIISTFLAFSGHLNLVEFSLIAALKTLPEFLLIAHGTVRWGQWGNLLLLPLASLLYPLYVLWIAATAPFAQHYNWKGRQVT